MDIPGTSASSSRAAGTAANTLAESNLEDPHVSVSAGNGDGPALTPPDNPYLRTSPLDQRFLDLSRPPAKRLHSHGNAHADPEWGLPRDPGRAPSSSSSSSPSDADATLHAKLASFHALKSASPPTHFNASLLSNRSFRNPQIYDKLVAYVGIDERMSGYGFFQRGRRRGEGGPSEGQGQGARDGDQDLSWGSEGHEAFDTREGHPDALAERQRACSQAEEAQAQARERARERARGSERQPRERRDTGRDTERRRSEGKKRERERDRHRGEVRHGEHKRHKESSEVRSKGKDRDSERDRERHRTALHFVPASKASSAAVHPAEAAWDADADAGADGGGGGGGGSGSGKALREVGSDGGQDRKGRREESPPPRKRSGSGSGSGRTRER